MENDKNLPKPIPIRENHFKNNFIEMFLENGTLHAIYLPNIDINLELAKEFVALRFEMFNKLNNSDGGHTVKSYPMLVDARNVRFVDKAARDYLNQGESLKGISAGAFIINTWAQELIGKFLFSLRTPAVPTRLFREKAKALAWLEKFK